MKKSRVIGIKAVLLTMAMLIAFFLCVFVAAGSLTFWQGWVCIACFCFPTLIITLYFMMKDPALIERRVAPTETRIRQKIIQSFAGMLFFFGLLVFPGLDYRYSLSGVPIIITLFANGLILAGFLSSLLCLKPILSHQEP